MAGPGDPEGPQPGRRAVLVGAAGTAAAVVGAGIWRRLSGGASGPVGSPGPSGAPAVGGPSAADVVPRATRSGRAAPTGSAGQGDRATVGGDPYRQGRPGDAAGTVLASFFPAGLTLTRHGGFGWTRISVLAGQGPGGIDALRVRYPANSASQRAMNADDTSDGGAQGYLRRDAGRLDQAWLSYHVRFPSGFDFVKGGKLPGLFGGTVTSGQHIPNGTNGFSTRYMWRTGGAGEVYAYLPTSVVHGTSLGRGDWYWPTGRWAHVVQHVRLNAPGAADGSIEVWFDGARVLTRTGLEFRTVADLRVEGLFFSTFFGGGDASWASPRDQYADFAGFVLSDMPLPVTA